MAGMCRVWLVEPPVACSATIEVDQRLLVDDFTDRHEVAILFGQTRDLMRGFTGQRITQWRVRVDERGPRQVQAHDFHQQLVGVGSAVEGAGTRAVVGLHLRFQQLFAGGFAFGVLLAYVGFFLVGNPRDHRPARDENRRQVTEAQRAHHQARHDLVADAEHQRTIEHVVRERHGSRHGNDFAARQAQFHARLALGHTVAHRRRAASKLADRADFAQGVLDLFREDFIRLVRREHVVIRRNNGDVRRVHHPQAVLVFAAATGHAVGEVGALQLAAHRPVSGGAANQCKVSLTRGAAAGDKPFGDLKDAGMHV